MVRLDRQMLGLAGGYAIAALLALAIAMALRLENPYWAGVAVYVTASQPSQGLLVQRVVFRLIGTAVGCLVGLLIVYFAHQPITVVLVLTAWVTLCAAIGNLFRQFRAYAWFLSGYTAAIIVLPSYFDTAHQHHFAEARAASNFIGTFCVIAVMLAFRHASEHDATVAKLERAAVAVMRWVAGVLRDDPKAADPAIARRLLIELATIEDAADAAATPSLDGYRVVRQIRHATVSLVALIAAARAILQQGGAPSGPDQAAAAALADRIEARIAASPETRAVAAQNLLSFREPTALADLMAVVRSVVVDLQRLHAARPAGEAARIGVSHRDWHAMRMAAIRTSTAMLVVGLGWVISGLSWGAMSLIGTAIFVTVFSNLEGARQAVETVIKGSLIGLIAALVAAATVVPLAHSQAQLLFAVSPFILAGAVGLAYPPTTRLSIDANAVFLIALQLSWPPLGDVWHTAASGLSLIAGMPVPWLAYYLLPLRPAQRAEVLMQQIMRDLDRLHASPASRGMQRQRLRLYHRVMQLALRLAARPNDPRLDRALTALAAVHAVHRPAQAASVAP